MGAYAWVFDCTLLVLIVGIAYAVGSEGLYGASLMFVNVMFAGLVAFSLFEPCARVIAANVGFMATVADFVCLIVLFIAALESLRFATGKLGPRYVRFHGAVDQIGRYLFGLATAWYLVGMLVCMVQTAPVHKKFLGYQWQNHSFWTVGIDRYWLGFAQATTQRIFDWTPPRPFDPKSDFIPRYHRFRPFGEPDFTMPGFRPAGPGSGAAAQPSGAVPSGSVQPSQPAQGAGRPPVDPVGATQLPPTP